MALRAVWTAQCFTPPRGKDGRMTALPASVPHPGAVEVRCWALDSYKEYIELFAHSLKQTMSSREGIAYLLKACGFEVSKEDINLQPETRWKVQR